MMRPRSGSIPWSVMASIAIIATLAASPAEAFPGERLWTRRLDGAGGYDSAFAMAAGPDGATVFVTGSVLLDSRDYATVAYDTSTGEERWITPFDGPRHRFDVAVDIAADPGGTRVFVTGTSRGWTGLDIATVAHDATTGATLWVRRYRGPAGIDQSAAAIATSPDGTTVFVAGTTHGTAEGTRDDYVTVAYEASSGTRLWIRRFDAWGSPEDRSQDAVTDLVAAGSKVFVTGTSARFGVQGDFSTVAYDASSGTRLWDRRYDGPVGSYDVAEGLAASSDGSIVYVTGTSPGATFWDDYATVAYDGATGASIWARRYSGPGGEADSPSALAVSPDGSLVAVTGWSSGVETGLDYATVAYDGLTGEKRWIRRARGQGNGWDLATAIAIGPDGSEVYVTGSIYRGITGDDYGTIAYEAATGSFLWKRFEDAEQSFDVPESLAVRPDGSAVFVTGRSSSTLTSFDYLTVAYAT